MYVIWGHVSSSKTISEKKCVSCRSSGLFAYVDFCFKCAGCALGVYTSVWELLSFLRL